MRLFGTIIFTEKYEGGLPNIKAPKDLQIIFKGNQMTIATLDLFGKKTLNFSPEQVLEVGLDQQKFRSAGKTVAGAVIGGFLTGGIGLLAGAAMGAKRRVENNLQLAVKYEGKDYEVHFLASKKTQELYNELVSFSSKAVRAEPITPEVIETPVEPENDIVSELERLHGLIQKGILTQEEFEMQKRKLLS
jgi:hypothetical protein